MSALTQKELIIGLHIRCIYNMSRQNQTAKITGIDPDSAFHVEWDDGYNGYNFWRFADSFEAVLTPFTSTKSITGFKLILPKLDSGDAVALKPEEKPCRTCTRMNYLDCKVCWSCGNLPF